MSPFIFGCYRGHLSAALIRAVETKFTHVHVINYKEPRRDRRGWFEARNYGSPFNESTAREVLSFARSIARGRDADVLP